MYIGLILPNVIKNVCLTPWSANENSSSSLTSRYWHRWLNISPKDSSEVYVAFWKRVVLECLYSISSAKEIGSYLKQYAVDCSDWGLLANVFNVFNEETKRLIIMHDDPNMQQNGQE
jgi:hypothetical protein